MSTPDNDLVLYFWYVGCWQLKISTIQTWHCINASCNEQRHSSILLHTWSQRTFIWDRRSWSFLLSSLLDWVNSELHRLMDKMIALRLSIAFCSSLMIRQSETREERMEIGQMWLSGEPSREGTTRMQWFAISNCRKVPYCKSLFTPDMRFLCSLWDSADLHSLTSTKILLWA